MDKQGVESGPQEATSLLSCSAQCSRGHRERRARSLLPRPTRGPASSGGLEGPGWGRGLGSTFPSLSLMPSLGNETRPHSVIGRFGAREGGVLQEKGAVSCVFIELTVIVLQTFVRPRE